MTKATEKDSSVIHVTIGSLAHGGDAVTRLDDGRVVFVRGGCPGDEAEIEIVGDHGRWLSARLVRLVEASPSRVEPPCPYFGECGGCQWQHVDYGSQIAAKTTIVSDALERIGHLENVPVQPCIPSPSRYGYRNKIELIAAELDTGLRLGFKLTSQESLVPVERCLLLPETLQDAPYALTGALRHLRSRHGDLGLRRVALRMAANTDDIEISLWTDPGPFPRRMAAKALEDALGCSGVVRVLIKGPDEKHRVMRVEVLKGRGAWCERMAGHTYTVSAPTFFKANTSAAERLVTTVAGLLDPGPEDRLLDMYAGGGIFTLPLADRVGKIAAVESSSHALRDLRRNLERAGVSTEIVGGDAARELEHLGSFDLAVADPPRSGIDANALLALAGARPRRIAYVSGDPATLARDAAVLAAHGYKAIQASPFDLSPQTHHVETIVLFESS